MRLTKVYRNAVTIFIIFTFFAIAPQSVSAKLGEPQYYTADVNEYYNFTLTVDTSVQWARDTINQVQTQFTIVELPDNTSSGIEILFITYHLINSSNQIFNEQLTAVNQKFALINTTFLFNQTIISPANVDSFSLNITLQAVTFGNDTSQDASNAPAYVYQFPEQISILSQQVQAFVNLYGFPPVQFLLDWLVIIGPVAFLLLLPGIVSLIVKFLGSRKRMKENKVEVEKNTGQEPRMETSGEIGGTLSGSNQLSSQQGTYTRPQLEQQSSTDETQGNNQKKAEGEVQERAQQEDQL